MALFGKHENVALIAKRIQNREYANQQDLEQMLKQVISSPATKARHVTWMLSHPDAIVRSCGRANILRLNTDGLTEALMREMGGKTPAIAHEIAVVLMQHDPKRVYKQLGRMLHSKKKSQRLAALDLIAAQPDWTEYIGHLKSCLKDPEVSVRMRTIRILSSSPDHPTVYLILQNLLHDEDDAIRGIAIDALSEQPQPSVVEPFLERMPLEAPRVQMKMVNALSRLAKNPEAKVEEHVIPMLADENPVIRDAAIKLLRDIPNRKHVIRTFIRHCHGLAHWLRDRTQQTFMVIGRDVSDAFIELIRDDDPEVKVGAMLLASDGKNPAVVRALLSVLQSQDDWWIRLVAAEQLTRYDQPEVIDTFITMLNDNDMRLAVVGALGKMSSAKAVPALLRCLGDSTVAVRKATIDALQKTPFPEVAEALAHCAIDDRAPEVRAKAQEVLQQFGTSASNVLAAVQEVLRKREVEEREAVHVELEMETPRILG